ncbi:esterase B1-like isoform X2 [Eurosta solidaginis]
MVAHRIQQYRATTNETVVVPTTYGQVKGVKRKTIYNQTFYAFEGIPYAKPPIGELRFRAPQPPQPWTGVRNCTSMGNKPLQRHLVLGITEGSEDCLYLNVYAKELKSDRLLPVMVWIYGGGFQIGEATRDIYAPDYFMERDIVLVTLNYRLGALGFLSLSDPDLQVPGNAGLKDQLLALHWIKENIGKFNGDPNNITLFGESAGAASTHLLMLAPKAEGLFHKAILQSGNALCPWVESEPRDWAFRLAVELGYKGDNTDKEIFQYLTNTSGAKIVQTHENLILPQEAVERVAFAFTPVVEPYVSEDCLLEKPFKDLLITAWSNDIPVIMGFTLDEGLLNLEETKQQPALVNEIGDFVQVLPPAVKKERNIDVLKELGQRLKEAHFGDKTPSDQETLTEYLDLLAYRNFVSPTHRTLLARVSYASDVPTYLYRFSFDSPFFNQYRILKCGKSIRGICHADDLGYLFYGIPAGKLSSECNEYKTIQRMIAMWTSFAKTGNPNCAEIATTQWKPIEAEDADRTQLKCLNIDKEVKFITLPHEKLEVWKNLFTNNSLY